MANIPSPSGFAANQNRDNVVINITTHEPVFNDLYIDANGDIVTVSSVVALTQSIISSIWLWLGEYDFNTTLGTPYNNIFGNPHYDTGLIKYQLTQAILLVNNYLTTDQLADYGINKVINIDFIPNNNTRELKVEANILLNNGQIIAAAT